MNTQMEDVPRSDPGSCRGFGGRRSGETCGPAVGGVGRPAPNRIRGDRRSAVGGVGETRAEQMGDFPHDQGRASHVTIPGAIGDGSNLTQRQPARRDLNRRVVSPAVPRPMAPSTHEAGSGIARAVPLTWITYGLPPEGDMNGPFQVAPPS